MAISIGPNIFPKINDIPSIPGTSSSESTSSTDFGSLLSQAIGNVNQLQLDSSKATNDFMTGKSDDIHTMMIAGQKAELALQFTLQVRNKIMDAYNEIMRMSL